MLICVFLATETAEARGGKDGDGEVRVAGVCGGAAKAKLKLKARDGGIELEFEIEHSRGYGLWRVAIVHERRVVWKGSARTSRSSDAFRVERRLPDLVGADTVTARAWGPGGVTCRATATLP